MQGNNAADSDGSKQSKVPSGEMQQDAPPASGPDGTDAFSDKAACSKIPPTNEESDASKKEERVLERIADSLKRLFTVIIAISFTQAVQGLYAVTMLVLANNHSKIYIGIEFGLFVSFFSSMLVYYYHSDRQLEMLHVKYPGIKHNWFTLGFEFALITITMLPFLFMSKALSPMDGTSNLALGWFYAASILLMLFGNLLLFIAYVGRWVFNKYKQPENDNERLFSISMSNIAFWFACDTVFSLIMILVIKCSGWTYNNIRLMIFASVVLFTRSLLDAWTSWVKPYPPPTVNEISTILRMTHSLMNNKSIYKKLFLPIISGSIFLYISYVCLVNFDVNVAQINGNIIKLGPGGIAAHSKCNNQSNSDKSLPDGSSSTAPGLEKPLAQLARTDGGADAFARPAADAVPSAVPDLPSVTTALGLAPAKSNPQALPYPSTPASPKSVRSPDRVPGRRSSKSTKPVAKSQAATRPEAKE